MRLAIFDLDGTVLDTLDDITDAINLMLEKTGYRTIGREDVRKIVGSGARKLVRDSLPEEVSEERLNYCLDIYSKIYDASGSPKTRVFDGLNEVFSELKRRGYFIAVLSNKPQTSTDKVYEKYLTGYGFDIVCGQSETIKCKPDPAGALFIINKFGVPKDDVYFIGDGETDVKTAINAHVNGVGVLWGNRTRRQLESAGCKIFAETPKDLLGILPL